MQSYLYQLPGWPDLRCDAEVVLPLLSQVRYQQGYLIGQMESLCSTDRQKVELDAITEEVVKTSAIEGETLSPDEVRSSIARQLGINAAGLPAPSHEVEGVVKMMLDASANANKPLTHERLFGWHGALFPSGWSDQGRITVGAWRTDAEGPMQVVSGPIGRYKVHFQAPPAGDVGFEMDGFLNWHNNTPVTYDPVLRAALAHIWFVTIHPFDDGNGRIGRAIMDGALAVADNCVQRYYSLSSQIYAERQSYYAVLEEVQVSGSNDVTRWVVWFLERLALAIAATEAVARIAQAKRAFRESLPPGGLNPRQAEMIERLLGGLDGRLTSGKWASITGVSQDSAFRDIADLIAKGVLVPERGGGRSAAYRLKGGP